MAFVSGFEHDIFLSYARENNAPVLPRDRGWIDNLAADLSSLVRQFMGRPDNFSLWMDLGMPGNDDCLAGVDEACGKSAIFLFVLSPGYIRSPYCQAEVSHFENASQRGMGFEVNGRGRAFKVEMIHVDRLLHPFRDRNLSGYTFYEQDPVTRYETRFRRTSQDDTDQRYWTVLTRLAQDLARTLRELDQMNAQTRLNVYLADAPAALIQSRARLASELSGLGFGILPNVSNPHQNSEEAIALDLSQSRISVHFPSVEDPAGGAQAGRQGSQLRIALDRGRLPNLRTIVWMPPGSAGTFKVEELLRVAPGNPVPLLLSCPISDLVDTISEQMGRSVPKPRNRKPRGKVYIVCDEPDRREARSLAQRLHEEWSLDVLISHENESLATFRTRLNLANGLVLLYGLGDSEWLERRMERADQNAEGRIRNPLAAIQVCSGPPPKEPPGVFFHRVPVVHCPDGYRLAYLQGFYDALSRAEG